MMYWSGVVDVEGWAVEVWVGAGLAAGGAGEIAGAHDIVAPRSRNARLIKIQRTRLTMGNLRFSFWPAR